MQTRPSWGTSRSIRVFVLIFNSSNKSLSRQFWQALNSGAGVADNKRGRTTKRGAYCLRVLDHPKLLTVGFMDYNILFLCRGL